MALPSPASDALLQSADSPPPLPSDVLGEGGPPSLGGTSGVGSLTDGLPAFFYDPPIEAVVFAFGVNEDLQVWGAKGAHVSRSLHPRPQHSLHTCTITSPAWQAWWVSNCRLPTMAAHAGRPGAAARRRCCQQHLGGCRRAVFVWATPTAKPPPVHCIPRAATPGPARGAHPPLLAPALTPCLAGAQGGGGPAGHTLPRPRLQLHPAGGRQQEHAGH